MHVRARPGMPEPDVPTPALAEAPAPQDDPSAVTASRWPLASRFGSSSAAETPPSPPGIQFRLAVGAPNDPFEQEADRVAGRVHPGGSSRVPRSHAVVRPPSAGGARNPGGLLAARIATVDGGRPLPAGVRQELEPALGADFSAVRVHDGDQDRADTESLGAHAFTHGRHIWLGNGATLEDRGLLAHELTHVIQQGTDVRRRGAPSDTVMPGGAPEIQGAWYNFDIPFTDYQFDPSIRGIETAAGLARDTASDAVAWAGDKVSEAASRIWNRIKAVAEAGIDWIAGQLDAVADFAKSSIRTIEEALKGLVQRITSPLDLLNRLIGALDAGPIAGAWSLLSSGATAVWTGIKGTADAVLRLGQGLWSRASRYVSSMFDTLDGLFGNPVFRHLPDSWQRAARTLYSRAQNLWLRLRAAITSAIAQVRRFTDGVLNEVEHFVTKVTSFAIRTVIITVTRLADAWRFVSAVAADPIGYIRPYIDRLGAKLDADAPPRAKAFVREKITGTGPPSSGSGTTVIQRQPEKGHRPLRTVADADEVSTGLWSAISSAWSSLNIREMLLHTLVTMFWPPATFQAIREQFSELWHGDWVAAAGKLITPRWEFPEFFVDMWANLLALLDFPLALFRRLVNVLSLLMGYVTLVLVIGFAIAGGVAAAPAGVAPGILAGAAAGLQIAAETGVALAAAFLAGESLNVIRILTELYTTPMTQRQKDHDYTSIAGSALGIAVALLLEALMMFISGLVSGLVALIKGRRAPTLTPTDGSIRVTPTETAPPLPSASERPALSSGTAAPAEHPALPPGPPARTPRTSGPTVDPNTGQPVGRYIVDPHGNTLIEPQGGTTVGSGSGVWSETRYPNQSPYQQQHGPHGPSVPEPHGHGFQEGPGLNQRGTSLSSRGEVVPKNSPAAHWEIRKPPGEPSGPPSGTTPPPSGSPPGTGSASTGPPVENPRTAPATPTEPPRTTPPTETTPTGGERPTTATRSGTDTTLSLDERIAAIEAELGSARRRTREYQAGRRAAGRSVKGGPIKSIWNAFEELWILRRQRAYPDRTLLRQTSIKGVRTPSGDLIEIGALSETGRILDFLELDGTRALGGDLKSSAELLKSVKGGLKRSSSVEGNLAGKIGKQRAVEQTVLNAARQRGGKILFEGENVLTGAKQTVEVDPADFSSTVLTYGEIYPN